MTFPSRVPVFALDRFYMRGLTCRATMVPRGSGWARMSDHLPLVAELEPDLSGRACRGEPWWARAPRVRWVGGNRMRLLEGGDELFPAMRRGHGAGAPRGLARHLHLPRRRRGAWRRRCADRRRAARRARCTWWSTASAAWRPLPTPARLARRQRRAARGLPAARPLVAVVAAAAAAPAAPEAVRDRRRGGLRRRHQRHRRPQRPAPWLGRHAAAGLRRRTDRARWPIRCAHAARAMWARAHLGRGWRARLRSLAHSRRPSTRTRMLSAHPGRGASARPPAAARRQPGACCLRRARQPAPAARHRAPLHRRDAPGARSASTSPCPISTRAARFRRALREAAQRGVQVRLLLQGKVDYRIAALAARVLYDELRANGVHIYEYTPAFLHAKVALVDDRWATVGSSNIDPLSLLLNLEANVVVRDADFCAALAERLDRAFAVSRGDPAGAADRRAGGAGCAAASSPGWPTPICAWRASPTGIDRAARPSATPGSSSSSGAPGAATLPARPALPAGWPRWRVRERR